MSTAVRTNFAETRLEEVHLPNFAFLLFHALW
jgi:hypothetical protein